MSIVAHNLVAMNAQRQFGITTRDKAKSTEKLSSGYRINRAADDAAGLSISEKMRKQIRGLQQASRNALDGISLVQTADGAMNEITELLQRCNELAVQAANGTYSDTERGYIQDEVNMLAAEIERITDATRFNDRPILQGEGDGTIITTTIPQGNSLPTWVAMDQASASSGVMADTYTDASGLNYAASSLDFSYLATDPSAMNDLDGAGFHFTCCTCDNYYSVEFDASTTTSIMEAPTNNCYIYKVGIQNMTTASEILNAMYNALGNGNPRSHYTQMEIDGDKAIFHDNRENVYPNKSSGNGVFAPETVISTKSDAANYSITLQIGEENLPENSLDLEMANMTVLKTGSLDVTTTQNALNTIDIVRADLEHVSSERSRMGAYQNRLEHAVANLDNVAENVQASESRIRDTDMSKEMVKYSNLSILEQAGHAMMAQANQSNRGVLELLGQ